MADLSLDTPRQLTMKPMDKQIRWCILQTGHDWSPLVSIQRCCQACRALRKTFGGVKRASFWEKLGVLNLYMEAEHVLYYMVKIYSPVVHIVELNLTWE